MMRFVIMSFNVFNVWPKTTLLPRLLRRQKVGHPCLKEIDFSFCPLNLYFLLICVKKQLVGCPALLFLEIL